MEFFQDDQCKKGHIAYGEMSGHVHALKGDSFQVFKCKDYPKQTFIKAQAEVKLVHGKIEGFSGKEKDQDYHFPITLPPGFYVTGIVKETDWLTRTVRYVVD